MGLGPSGKTGRQKHCQDEMAETRACGPWWVDWGEIAPEQSQPLGLAHGSLGLTCTWPLWLRNRRRGWESSVRRHASKPGLTELPRVQEQELPGEGRSAPTDTDHREAVLADS